MFLKNFRSIVKPVSKSDLPYFLTSLLFFDIFFKYTRRYYYVFEDTLWYYFSFLSRDIVLSSLSFLGLSLAISVLAMILYKTIISSFYLSNILSFVLIFFLLKISDFPRTNFAYFLFIFPLLIFIIKKLKLNYLVKSLFLVIGIIISLNYQGEFFESREASFKSNILAEDIRPSVVNVFQDRDKLYNNRNNLIEFRTLDFNNKISIKEFILCCENIRSTVTKGKPIGYVEIYNDNLLYISATGDLFFTSINDLMSKSSSDFKKINTNFKEIVTNKYIYEIDTRFSWGGWESVRNIFYDQEYIYVSYIDEVEDECTTLSIIKGKLNFNNIQFKKFFSLNECISRNADRYTAAQSGGAIENFDEDHIIFTTGDFRQRKLPQDKNSQYGKTLKISKVDSSYEILSIGHRNAQGISKVDENLFLSTEHGPRMGDEINLIDTNTVNNYGWPLSSYGVHYESSFGINFVFDEVVDAPLNKSHKEFGFSEPIYYFGFDKVVEHGISDIEVVEVDNSNLNFLFGSMHYRRLYLGSYNLIDKNMVSLTSFNTGNRIRDIVKVDSNTYISVFEDPARIAVVTLNGS